MAPPTTRPRADACDPGNTRLEDAAAMPHGCGTNGDPLVAAGSRATDVDHGPNRCSTCDSRRPVPAFLRRAMQCVACCTASMAGNLECDRIARSSYARSERRGGPR